MSYCERALTRINTPAPIGDAAGAVTANVASTWQYLTIDAAATVETANYFDLAGGIGGGLARLNKGDVIIAHMAMGGTPILKAYMVTSVTTHVAIALQTTTAG